MVCICMISGKGKGGYLVEGSFSIEEETLWRGTWITYWYGVRKQDKDILGVAKRFVQIPPNAKGKSSKPYNLRMLSLNCLFFTFELVMCPCVCFIQSCTFMKALFALETGRGFGKLDLEWLASGRKKV